jgi:hypothetical protein
MRLQTLLVRNKYTLVYINKAIFLEHIEFLFSYMYTPVDLLGVISLRLYT